MLRCSPGEVLTVKVVPNDDTSKAIVYALDSKKHDGSPFPASDQGHPPKGKDSPTRIFSVGVVYLNKTTASGSAEITINGSGGGDTSNVTTKQSTPAEAGDIVNYLIFVF